MTRASAGPPDPAPAGTPGPAYALDNTVAADSVEDDDDDDDAPLPPDPEDTPTRIGRYTIIRRIGAGGMGQVYAAYDEQLDRKIAVKVLGRDLSRGVEWNARLVREAQVMARLSHPNVVTVHEIGEYDGQLFIAMEFVAGVTLEAWLAAAPRSWRAIIAAFIDAGRGLQAAHDAGIIHRDFKANNAMIGDDGRARVLDFGIAGPGDARPGDDALSLNPNTPSALRSALTVDGALLGTPIYMSPEQLSGAAVGAASDQFNFCVALYRALYATHPFVSEPFSFSALRINVIGGRLREPPRSRGVPGWVFAALRRGLEVRPDDRFASMNQLIAALTRDPGRRLRRILALVVFAGLAGLAGFAARAGLRPTEVNCDGGEQSMAALWSPQQRGVIGASFRATGLVFADAVLTTVAADLDAYTASWAEMHRDACAAHRDGEQSGALLDKRMACLERRRQALGSAVNLLAAPDEEVVQGAVRLVSELPRISHCGDVVALAAEVPPPDDPAVAEEVSRLRGRIDAASSLAAVGRQEEALVITKQVVTRARELSYRPLATEGLLAEGRTHLDFGTDPFRALPVLNDALLSAVGVGMNAEAAEALARRLYVVGLQGRTADALGDAALARAFLDRVSTPGPLLGLLSNNVGAVYVAAGDSERARAQFEEALSIQERLPEVSALKLSFTLANLAMQLDDVARREALFTRMSDLRRSALGDGHPITAHGAVLWSLYTVDPRAAARRLERACAAVDLLPGDHLLDRRQCRVYLAQARAEAGELELASDEYRRALAIAAPGFDESPDGVRALAQLRGYAALLSGASAEVLPALRSTREQLLKETAGGSADAWWVDLDIAEFDLALALNLEATGDDAGAAAALTRAIPVFAALVGARHEVALQQRLAAARAALARTLTRGEAPSEDDRARARSAAAQAQAWYQSAGPGYAWRLEQLAAWRLHADG